MMRKVLLIGYMDVRPGSATLAKISTSTLAAPARMQRPGAAVDRGAGGQHVVDEDQPAPGDGGLALVRHAKRALHVGRALGPRQPDLLCRRLDPLEGCRGNRDAAVRRDGCRQHGRLVEAPRPKPAPMQRHRHQRVGLGQQLAAGLADPASHHRRQIEPIAIFERMDQGARNLVETHRGAGAVIGRRVGDGFHGQDARTRVIDEGNAEPLAIGPGDEREFRPARRA